MSRQYHNTPGPVIKLVIYRWTDTNKLNERATGSQEIRQRQVMTVCKLHQFMSVKYSYNMLPDI